MLKGTIWYPQLTTGKEWEIYTTVHSILTVFLEPTSTSQLSSLSTAHSSWRYTATVWAHPHILQNGGEQSSHYYIWGMPTLWPKYIIWWWPQTGWYNGPGVWWAEHTPFCTIYWVVCSLTIKQLILIDMQWHSYWHATSIVTMCTDCASGGDWFSCCITSLASLTVEVACE